MRIFAERYSTEIETLTLFINQMDACIAMYVVEEMIERPSE